MKKKIDKILLFLTLIWWLPMAIIIIIVSYLLAFFVKWLWKKDFDESFNDIFGALNKIFPVIRK